MLILITFLKGFQEDLTVDLILPQRSGWSQRRPQRRNPIPPPLHTDHQRLHLKKLLSQHMGQIIVERQHTQRQNQHIHHPNLLTHHPNLPTQHPNHPIPLQNHPTLHQNLPIPLRNHPTLPLDHHTPLQNLPTTRLQSPPTLHLPQLTPLPPPTHPHHLSRTAPSLPIQLRPPLTNQHPPTPMKLRQSNSHNPKQVPLKRFICSCWSVLAGMSSTMTCQTAPPLTGRLPPSLGPGRNAVATPPRLVKSDHLIW